MAAPTLLDRCFDFIMNTFVKRGYGPHYTEIAKAFGILPEEGKNLLHELMDTGIMSMWLHPDTDLIASFAPFNNLPNQYRITVDGKQKWFAQ